MLAKYQSELTGTWGDDWITPTREVAPPKPKNIRVAKEVMNFGDNGILTYQAEYYINDLL